MPARLNAKKVDRYGWPRYPTRPEVSADAGLLEKHLPPAWLTRAEMAGALSALLAVSNGCSKQETPQRPALTASQPAMVAPIFEHGEGRGVTGCVAIAPPVFLSEEEASQVIAQALREHGIAARQGKLRTPGVWIRRWKEKEIKSKDWVTGEGQTQFEFVEGDGPPIALFPDLETADRRIQIEFISTHDQEALKAEETVQVTRFDGTRVTVSARSWSSVQHYHLKPLAAYVRTAIERGARDTYFGTFYDPSPRPEPSQTLRANNKEELNALEADAKAESKRLLRLQVQDFVNWLEAQGAI